MYKLFFPGHQLVAQAVQRLSAPGPGIVGVAPCAKAPQGANLNQNLRRLGCVAVAELAHVVMAAIRPATPVGRSTAMFDPLRSRRNPREVFAMRVKMKLVWFGVHCMLRKPARRARMASRLAFSAPWLRTENHRRATTYGSGLQIAIQYLRTRRPRRTTT